MSRLELSFDRALAMVLIVCLFIIMAALVAGVLVNNHNLDRTNEVSRTTARLASDRVADNRRILETLRADSRDGHERIVRYIKCVVLVPPDERNSRSLDRCAAAAFPPTPSPTPVATPGKGQGGP